MFNRVNQFCQSYYNELPADGLKTALKSSIFSFTASILLCCSRINQTPDFPRIFVASLIGGVASVIHVLTTPFFNYLFDNPHSHTFSGIQEMIKYLVNVTFTQLLINKITASNFNLITAIIPKGENFFIFASNNIKVIYDISKSLLDWMSSGGAVRVQDPFARDPLEGFFDFNKNPPPIYLSY